MLRELPHFLACLRDWLTCLLCLLREGRLTDRVAGLTPYFHQLRLGWFTRERGQGAGIRFFSDLPLFMGYLKESFVTFYKKLSLARRMSLILPIIFFKAMKLLKD